MGQCVGEAGAIHVQMQALAAAGLAEFGHLIHAIDGAPFGGLGDADRFGHHVVHAAVAGSCHAGLHLRGRDAAGFGGQRHQLGAAHVEFRGAALVGGDVGFLVAEHRAVGAHQRGQRQRVCRGAGGDRVEGQVGLEEVARAGGQPCGERVRAVGRYVAGVGLCQGGHDFRADGGGVVAGEVHVCLLVLICLPVRMVARLPPSARARRPFRIVQAPGRAPIMQPAQRHGRRFGGRAPCA